MGVAHIAEPAHAVAELEVAAVPRDAFLTGAGKLGIGGHLEVQPEPRDGREGVVAEPRRLGRGSLRGEERLPGWAGSRIALLDGLCVEGQGGGARLGAPALVGAQGDAQIGHPPGHDRLIALAAVVAQRHHALLVLLRQGRGRGASGGPGPGGGGGCCRPGSWGLRGSINEHLSSDSTPMA